ncbi:PorV/PorQ family protein [bacterium]|nr:PorV/PorQ family protein [bacterium]
MKNYKRLFCVAVILIGTASAVQTSERGTTGADFLKIGLGAGAAGMGEAFTAVKGDVNAMFYNPAGLTGLEMNMLSATHLNWIAETQYEALAYARPVVGVGTLGTAIYFLHMPEIPSLDVNGNSTGMLQAYDLGVQFSYARDISPFVHLAGLSAGASLKIIHRKLADLSASGIALDLGTLYAMDEQLTFGLSFLNLGYLSSFDAESEQLPMMIRGGVGYEMRLAGRHAVLGTLDLVQALDNVIHANLGLEYSFADIVNLRVGYKLGYDTEGLQAGAGVQWRTMAIDYAFKLMDIFGGTHFLTASLGFGTSVRTMQADEIKKILQQAEAMYSQSKYAEALEIVEKAILVDADNQRALQLREKLKTVLMMLEMPQTEVTPEEPVESLPQELTPDEQEEMGAPQPEEVQ